MLRQVLAQQIKDDLEADKLKAEEAAKAAAEAAAEAEKQQIEGQAS